MNFSRKTLAMDYAPPDSSGTDDDLPASHHNRDTRGHIVGNGRSALGAHLYPRAQIDMESQIHWLEQEAYCSVLKAFRAQADSISWEKNDLMNNLRRELRISDEEYGELKSRVDADDIVKKIREWRQAGGSQSGLLHNPPGFSSLVSPTASALRKRQKTSHSIASLPVGAPSHLLHAQPDAATSSSLRGVPLGAKGEKSKPGHSLTGVSTMKSLQFSSTVPSGMGQVTNRSSFAAMEPGGTATYDPLIGRKVKTRWPADNHFYEAEITDYCEISPEDIKWEGEDPGIFDGVGRSGSGGGIKKPTGHNGAITDACRGRGSLKTNLVPSTHGPGKKRAHDIKILNTEILVKEVDRVFAASHPDPLEIEKVKKMLEEHEQSLLCVIASLADASDGESEEAGQWNQHGANPDDAILVA